MKTVITLIFVIAMVNIAFATTRIVDINGGGGYTSINAAIQASVAGDTVKVWPGIYNQQVNLNKDVVLMGSGYEGTILSGSYNPVVLMNTGKLMWFRVTSYSGDGIKTSGGTVSNCAIISCLGEGILSNTNGAITQIFNCVFYKNNLHGIQGSNGATINVINCIGWSNGAGFYYDSYSSSIVISYSFSDEPQFVSEYDIHLQPTSSCVNGGSPSLFDPDGSRSDIGYFGGPDCPIYPVVTEILITPGVSTINLQAKARANY
ncbi:MAG: hypothetical protein C0417_02730 [Chlorobiaceae bacterium]|nr:hypothetical protein [Chlorobiaceae bacterium]